jgi:hypothetical protein
MLAVLLWVVCWCACIPLAVLGNFMGPLLVLLRQVGLSFGNNNNNNQSL